MRDKLKGVYLASYHALHPQYNLDYQDKIVPRDIGGCMLETNLANYDFIIATPPCNYYSKANYRREISQYAQATKHLLPSILNKLRNQNKPYIVENVINRKLMKDFLIHEGEYLYFIGRHTYFSNVKLPNGIKQDKEPYLKDIPSSKRQGGKNVFYVIEEFLKVVHHENNL